MPCNLLIAMSLQKRSSWKVGWTSDSSSNILRAAATLCKASWVNQSQVGNLSLSLFNYLRFALVHEAVGMFKVHLVKRQFINRSVVSWCRPEKGFIHFAGGARSTCGRLGDPFLAACPCRTPSQPPSSLFSPAGETRC